MRGRLTRRLLAGMVVSTGFLAVAGGVAGSGAAAFRARVAVAPPPDLTGSWQQLTSPSSPPWQFVTANGGQTLSVTWTGSGSHSGLHGSFTGTLDQSSGKNVYSGPMQVTEGSFMVGGTMSFDVVSANVVLMSYQQDNGPHASNVEFIRLGGAPTLTQVPAPGAYDKPVSAPAPAPGDAATNASPLLGDTTSVTATELGLTPEDFAVLAGLKHQCYADFVKSISFNTIEVMRVINGTPDIYFEMVPANIPKALANLAFCVAFVDVLAASVSNLTAVLPNAVAAKAGCGGPKATFVLRGKGRKTKIKSLKLGATKLHVTCKTIPGGLAIKFSTRSKKPLRQLVGPRLRIAVLRSKHDSPGGQLTFSYHKG